MSFNAQPAWCEVETPDDSWADVKCPTCNKDYSKKAKELLAETIKSTYYEACHIPPSIIVTCDNEKCDDCDNGIIVFLKTVH